MKFASVLVASLAWLVAPAAAAKDERTFAVLRFNNKAITRGRVDPIVSPGKTSTHVHSVMGGSSFGISSTGEELMNSKCSNAMVKGDNSNYWFPALYFQDPKTGKFEDVDIFYVNVYYFFEPTNDEIKAFPVGMQMTTGNATTRLPPAFGSATNLDPSKGPINAIKWTCPRKNFDPPNYPANSNGMMAGVQDPINKGEGIGFPDMNCDGYASPLRADMHFPSCYNPKAGLTNYKENTVFPSDNNGKQDCPKGWIHTPHLFFEIYWNTPIFADRWTQGQGKQPFVLANGDATGYSSHGDFMAAWNVDLLQHIIDTCDTGTGGMDTCTGLTYGLNKGDCTIPSPIDERTTGTLDKLPGDNPVTGWRFGNAGGSSGSSGSNPSQGKPSSSAGYGSGSHPPSKSPSKPTSKAPAHGGASPHHSSSSSPSTKPASHDLGLPGKQSCAAHVKTVTHTHTITRYGPAETKAARSRRHLHDHARPMRRS